MTVMQTSSDLPNTSPEKAPSSLTQLLLTESIIEENPLCIPPLQLKSQLHTMDFGKSDVQYCAKVMQAKCATFVLCSRDFSTKVRSKVRMKFHGISSDNSLEQRAIFLRSFVQPKKICEHKR